MQRRTFLQLTGAALAAACAGAPLARSRDATLDVAAFHRLRRHAALSFGRIAYVERGAGDVALFLHGAPLNGYQWRGAIERLSLHRRCIAPDFMGLGYTDAADGQSLRADAQAAMLVALMDALGVRAADVIASDSGTAVAQILAARHPARVRSLLLTNGDVEPDSPPAKVMPAIEMARAGTLADATAKWLTDRDLARSTFGAAVFAHPERLAAETIDCYAAPLVATPRRRAQYHAFHVALAPNPLAGIEAALRRCTMPVRIVWGDADDIFAPADADYLDRTFANSRGVRRVPGGKLFFAEEFPEVIAEEARRLWGLRVTAA